MDGIFLVFADSVEQFRIGKQIPWNRNRPRFGVSARVVNRDLNRDVAEVGTAEPLDNFEAIGVRVARVVKPGFGIDPDRIHHEGVPFPPPGRIAEPPRLRVRRQRTAIGKDLPKRMVALKKQNQDAWGLNELFRIKESVEVRHAVGQAAGAGAVAAIVLDALFVQLLRPRQHRNGDAIGAEVVEVLVRRDEPDAGEIRSPIGRSGSGGGEVRFAIFGSWSARCGIVHPLAPEWADRHTRGEQKSAEQGSRWHRAAYRRGVYTSVPRRRTAWGCSTRCARNNISAASIIENGGQFFRQTSRGFACARRIRSPVGSNGAALLPFQSANARVLLAADGPCQTAGPLRMEDLVQPRFAVAGAEFRVAGVGR